MLTRRFPVLTYHQIEEGRTPLVVSPARFRMQMRHLRDDGWRTLSLDDLLAGLDRPGWPERRCMITFDDGFASVARHALPVLAECGFTAWLFIVPAYVGRTNDWPTESPAVPRAPLLDWPELAALGDAGFEIGAHSMTHPDLTRLAERDARREIIDSQRVILERLGCPVRAFAYPYGECSNEVEWRVAGHFAAGFGTTLDFVTPQSRASFLPRIDAYYLPERPALDSSAFAAYLSVRRQARRVRRAALRRFRDYQ